MWPCAHRSDEYIAGFTHHWVHPDRYPSVDRLATEYCDVGYGHEPRSGFGLVLLLWNMTAPADLFTELAQGDAGIQHVRIWRRERDRPITGGEFCRAPPGLVGLFLFAMGRLLNASQTVVDDPDFGKW